MLLSVAAGFEGNNPQGDLRSHATNRKVPHQPAVRGFPTLVICCSPSWYFNMKINKLLFRWVFLDTKNMGGGLFMMLAYKLITSKEMRKMENFSSLTSPGNRKNSESWSEWGTAQCSPVLKGCVYLESRVWLSRKLLQRRFREEHWSEFEGCQASPHGR